ncbi:MAG: hypothetical protein LBK66_00040 [Spirochaetaceae bacterium]|jgi:hypothetical protein|nr:hypothetical protein [Spirochaetaceae bacterium]
MGFLGLCLLFAGIALIMMVAAGSTGAKTTAFTNRATVSILEIGNFIGFDKADVFSPTGCNGTDGFPVLKRGGAQ